MLLPLLFFVLLASIEETTEMTLTFHDGGCQYNGHNMPHGGEGFQSGCIYIECNGLNRTLLLRACPPQTYHLPRTSMGATSNDYYPNCCPGHEV
uniref:Single domain-containing protein n=1 Tax=Amblyomma cajennense TaxID=34607 RepID=A0A023FDM3_AMBCJ